MNKTMNCTHIRNSNRKFLLNSKTTAVNVDQNIRENFIN